MIERTETIQIHNLLTGWHVKEDFLQIDGYENELKIKEIDFKTQKDFTVILANNVGILVKNNKKSVWINKDFKAVDFRGKQALKRARQKFCLDVASNFLLRLAFLFIFDKIQFYVGKSFKKLNTFPLSSIVFLVEILDVKASIKDINNSPNFTHSPECSRDGWIDSHSLLFSLF